MFSVCLVVSISALNAARASFKWHCFLSFWLWPPTSTRSALVTSRDVFLPHWGEDFLYTNVDWKTSLWNLYSLQNNTTSTLSRLVMGLNTRGWWCSWKEQSPWNSNVHLARKNAQQRLYCTLCQRRKFSQGSGGRGSPHSCYLIKYKWNCVCVHM